MTLEEIFMSGKYKYLTEKDSTISVILKHELANIVEVSHNIPAGVK